MYGKYKGTLMIAMSCDIIINYFLLLLSLQKVKIQIVGGSFWHALELV